MEQSVSYTDLLIIGAGPAGLIAALWASQYGVSTRIIDDKPGRVTRGHADGITCRTMEVFESFGLAHKVLREAALDFQIRHWRTDSQGRIERTQSLVVQAPGVSRFQACLLGQGRLEELLEAKIAENSARGQGNTIVVERNVQTVQLLVRENDAASQSSTPSQSYGGDTDGNGNAVTAYPVEVRIRHGISTKIETIRAKYVIGADGANSWTRRQLGVAMCGDKADEPWGVIDILPLSDFPDMRQTCVIQSRHGSIHVVPREGKLVRLYVQLDEVYPLVERSKITASMILAAAQRIFHPFRLECSRVDWWSVYHVGQRLADTFTSAQMRVFLVGDAIHTHSPKIGQGMNVSMQDSYNLSWKVCGVLKGYLHRHVLTSFEQERRPVAEQLLRTDQVTVDFYKRRAAGDAGAVQTDLQAFRNSLYAFLSGVAVEYAPGHLVCEAHSGVSNGHTKQEARDSTNENVDLCLPAKSVGIALGQRMPSFIVINHATATPTQLASKLAADGRWRLMVFAGDLLQPEQQLRVVQLGDHLASPESFCSRHKMLLAPVDDDRRGTPDSEQPSRTCKGEQGRLVPLFEIVTVMSNPRDDFPLLSLAPSFRPWDAVRGWDYDCVFSDEADVYGNFQDAYACYGVDRTRGCLVVCRPDQHVAFVGELGAGGTAELDKFCAGVFQ